MKQALFLLLIASLLLSCGRNSGTIEHKIKFTTESASQKSAGIEPESRYTELGDYITSITPRYFGARISVIMYHDKLNPSESNMIGYLDGNTNLVDFSNNVERSYNPTLHGDLFDGLFRQKEVTMNYFYLVPDYFEQEFEIPAEYADVVFLGPMRDTYTDPQTGKRLYKGTQLLPEIIYGYPSQQPWGYIFGNIDRTMIVNRECIEMPSSDEYPGGGNHCIVRSNHFTPVTVTMPDDGETIEMYSTISFNTENLIQVYAGADNIPYTPDDWFTYAPFFWERIAINLEVR